MSAFCGAGAALCFGTAWLCLEIAGDTVTADRYVRQAARIVGLAAMLGFATLVRLA